MLTSLAKPSIVRAAAVTLALLLLGFAPDTYAQSLEELELKKSAGEEDGAGGLNLGFGVTALLENGTGLNRDRPDSSTLLMLSPQLKAFKTVRLQADLRLLMNHLERAENPWDLPDWGLKLADLQIWKDPWAGIGLSGYVSYSFPTSIGSRNRTRYGVARANLKLGRSFGPVYVSAEANGMRYFHEYTSSDTTEWQEEGNIQNNPGWGLNQRYTLSYSPTQRLSLSLIWSMTQLFDAQADDDGAEDPWALSSSGGSYSSSRLTDVAEHSYLAVADMTYGLSDNLFVAAGYAAQAPQLQNGGHDRSLNPFNPKYSQLYVDLMFIY